MNKFNVLFDIIVGILFILIGFFGVYSILLMVVGILYIVKGIINLRKKN